MIRGFTAESREKAGLFFKREVRNLSHVSAGTRSAQVSMAVRMASS